MKVVRLGGDPGEEATRRSLGALRQDGSQSDGEGKTDGCQITVGCLALSVADRSKKHRPCRHATDRVNTLPTVSTRNTQPTPKHPKDWQNPSPEPHLVYSSLSRRC
jgi:hypothetical protein